MIGYYNFFQCCINKAKRFAQTTTFRTYECFSSSFAGKTRLLKNNNSALLSTASVAEGRRAVKILQLLRPNINGNANINSIRTCNTFFKRVYLTPKRICLGVGEIFAMIKPECNH